ncbi:MAG: hypothetical protein HY981_03605 [Candidatus Magasanikbacteria bacterium]|nr:hypothetical protein [Candidatus Magasanikbacteria bacterium]
MLIPNLKKEFTVSALINSIFYAILGIVILIALLFSLFLYNNFYTTISRAETVLILKSELAVDTLDVPLYEKIKKEIDASISRRQESAGAASSSSTVPLLLKDIPNPFLSKPF